MMGLDDRYWHGVNLAWWLGCQTCEQEVCGSNPGGETQDLFLLRHVCRISGVQIPAGKCWTYFFCLSLCLFCLPNMGKLDIRGCRKWNKKLQLIKDTNVKWLESQSDSREAEKNSGGSVNENWKKGNPDKEAVLQAIYEQKRGPWQSLANFFMSA